MCSLALAVAACGGSEDEGLTTDEYRQQARTICAEAARATSQIEQPTRATSAAIVDYLNRLLRTNERTTERFAGLEPPEELERAHADALRANRDGVAEVRRVIRELDGGGDAREVLASAQTRLTDLSERSSDAARRLGVPECADAPEGQ